MLILMINDDNYIDDEADGGASDIDDNIKRDVCVLCLLTTVRMKHEYSIYTTQIKNYNEMRFAIEYIVNILRYGSDFLILELFT